MSHQMPAMPKANEMKTHERLAGDEPAKGGLDRGFGVVFAVVFVAIGLFPLLNGGPPRAWALRWRRAASVPSAWPRSPSARWKADKAADNPR